MSDILEEEEDGCMQSLPTMAKKMSVWGRN